MKAAIGFGILLIVLGVISLAYQGSTYTHQEKILDLGPIQASETVKERMSLPPILGGLALVGGVALVVVGSRRKM